jgi:hypothetical protein
MVFYQLITNIGKPRFQTFMPSVMSSKDKCLLTKLRKKVSQLLNKFWEKEVMLTTTQFQELFILILRLPM